MPLSRREATGRFVHMQVWRVRKALWSRLCTHYLSEQFFPPRSGVTQSSSIS